MGLHFGEIPLKVLVVAVPVGGGGASLGFETTRRAAEQ